MMLTEQGGISPWTRCSDAGRRRVIWEHSLPENMPNFFFIWTKRLKAAPVAVRFGWGRAIGPRVVEVAIAIRSPFGRTYEEYALHSRLVKSKLSVECDSMSQVVIENPIINSPFDEPARHFRFSDEGITNEEVEGRRTSSYFVPIAKAKKKGAKQLQFDTEWTQDRIEENKLVNDIRRRVGMWRDGGHVGVTPTTARLIVYWTDPNREKKLFFCQNEALETGAPATRSEQPCEECSMSS